LAARLCPDTLGALMRSQALLAAIREPNSKGKEREGMGNGEGKIGR